MAYTTEEIAHALKVTREAKGLSQRALSAKVGLTQTQISKIENASTDPRLSNLMELARALDLEVMLVPRKAVPAAQSLVRNIQTVAEVPPPSKTVRYLERSFEKLAALYPEASDIPKLRNLVAIFRNFHLNKEQIHEVTVAAREMHNVADSLHKRKVSNLQNSPADLQRISQITNQLRHLRNEIVHAVPPSTVSRVRPAYRLDDGESDG